MIPSRTPSPDGANIARMPIIAETPQIPAQNSSSEYSTAGEIDFVRMKNPTPTISQFPMNSSTTFNICEYFIGISRSFLKSFPSIRRKKLIIFG